MNTEQIYKLAVVVLTVLGTLFFLGASVLFGISYLFAFLVVFFGALTLLIIELHLRVQHNINRKTGILQDNQKKFVDLLEKLIDTYHLQDTKLNDLGKRLDSSFSAFEKLIDTYHLQEKSLQGLRAHVDASETVFREQLRQQTDTLLDYLHALRAPPKQPLKGRRSVRK